MKLSPRIGRRIVVRMGEDVSADSGSGLKDRLRLRLEAQAKTFEKDPMLCLSLEP